MKPLYASVVFLNDPFLENLLFHHIFMKGFHFYFDSEGSKLNLIVEENKKSVPENQGIPLKLYLNGALSSRKLNLNKGKRNDC